MEKDILEVLIDTSEYGAIHKILKEKDLLEQSLFGKKILLRKLLPGFIQRDMEDLKDLLEKENQGRDSMYDVYNRKFDLIFIYASEIPMSKEEVLQTKDRFLKKTGTLFIEKCHSCNECHIEIEQDTSQNCELICKGEWGDSEGYRNFILDKIYELLQN